MTTLLVHVIVLQAGWDLLVREVSLSKCNAASSKYNTEVIFTVYFMACFSCVLFTDCEQGTFGPNCEQVCDCKEAVSCDKITGKCLCKPGYRGDKCDIGMSV